jgi:UDP-N-acetylglucosamine--N-acetylmuramyl-(pentapeptide) pyrophosphoryl-undecaprenol N-acetylglucosamine transferase
MPLKILIAAGGTGGHIYPALAIVDAFLEQQPDIHIEFVGTPHGLENRIIPARGFALHHLPIGRLNSNVPLAERLKTVLKMPLALLKSWRILRRARPDFVLGVGGHASGPLLLVASLLGYRTAIWEPNAMPGLANRWLAKFVDDCWVVFDEAKVKLANAQVHQAGMPVRREIEDLKIPQRKTDSTFRILVFGGSQGARGLNNTVCAMLREGGEWLQGLHFVHQTGSVDYARIRQEYGAILNTGLVDVREYLHDMGAQYAAADLVICRSGTGTLSELAACGKPAILVPLPTAADDHQRKNAESLVNKGAALMVLQKDLNTLSLREAIQKLRNQPQLRQQMSVAVKAFHQPRAAQHLANALIGKINDHAAR